MKSIRLTAAEILLEVVDHGRSLNDLLPETLAKTDADQHAFLQQLVYGTTRYYFALDELVNHMVKKPLNGKERLVHMLLAVGLYQLWKLDVAEHAAINETVNAAVDAKRPWATGLLNASLRRFQREKASLVAQMRRSESFPGWLNKRLRLAWPEQYGDICHNSNQQAPMTLRVNQQRLSRQQWLEKAEHNGMACFPCASATQGVVLAAPAPVMSLPGFNEGEVSVQDEAAQMCAEILNVQDGEIVLDACAAPGGKTGHLLESADIHLTALDVDETRLDRVAQNLARIQRSAKLIVADAANVTSWWDGELFDAVLLDAPCSGTGVIRRHPDIKLLRKSADIKALSIIQKSLLQALWSTVKPGGRLLYATCSILPDENAEVISAFVNQTSDAIILPLQLTGDVDTTVGVQWLPQPAGHDGFYYALLSKAL